MPVLFRSEFPTRSGSRFRHIDFDCRRFEEREKISSFRKRILILWHQLLLLLCLDFLRAFPTVFLAQQESPLTRSDLYPAKSHSRQAVLYAYAEHKKIRPREAREVRRLRQ